MRFRAGMALGFCAGYYLGAMAGRERYDQINGLLDKVKRSEVFEVATEKAREVVDLGVDRAGHLLNGNGEAAPQAPAGPGDYSSSR